MAKSAKNKYLEAMAGIDETTYMPVTWWNPTKCDVIGGIVRRIGERETSHGPKKVIEIDCEGEVFARTVNGPLQSEINANDVQPGDEIALKYLGKRTSSNAGRSYHLYAVKVLTRVSEKSDDTSAKNDEFADDIPF